MVIGHGMMARAFACYQQDEEVVVFASGVSNSSERDPRAYGREEALLERALSELSGRLLVYFSTCSVVDPHLLDTSYVQHKLAVEDLIVSRAGHYLVTRLPQVVGRTDNRSTLVHYLHDCIVAGRPFELWSNAVRYIIDVDDAALLVGHLIERARADATSEIVSVYSLPSTVLEIVRGLEAVTGRSAKFTSVERGSSYLLESPALAEALAQTGVVFGPDYLRNVLRKYFGQ
jgi:nucleoside-diphosphate-sugar epimerase